ncbi:MAG: SGNH/GDSL hydrolase family protein [Desulfuromonadales bacterium]
MKRKSFFLNLLTVLVSILLGLVACEIILVAIGWSPQRSTSDYLQFGYSTGVPVWDEDGVLEEARPVRVKLFQYDEDLFWKTIPDTDFTNAQGFRGTQDVAVDNPNNAVRILILGDSCSFLGRKLYADYLHDKLSRDYPGVPFEIINASVPGYTSFQGEKILQRVLAYKPQYACIYFGWNDHWILPSGYSDRFHYALIHNFKVIQLVQILLARVLDVRDYRVPIADYRANLTAMVNQLQGNGVIPILIAAPAGYGKAGMPPWAFDFYREYYRMTPDEIKRIPETHKAYAEVVNQVSKQYDTIFVDGQQSLNSLTPTLGQFFRNDLIHLTSAGHEAIANEIYHQMKSYHASGTLSLDDLVRTRSGQ